jgi:hypothetical protein
VHFTVRPVQSLSACTTVHFTVRPIQSLSACTRVRFTVRPVQSLSACIRVHFTVRPVQSLSACTTVHFTFYLFTIDCWTSAILMKIRSVKAILCKGSKWYSSRAAHVSVLWWSWYKPLRIFHIPTLRPCVWHGAVKRQFWAAYINFWTLFPTLLFHSHKIRHRRAPNKRTERLHLPWYWPTPGFTQALKRISVLIFNTFISLSVIFGAKMSAHNAACNIWFPLNLSRGRTDTWYLRLLRDTARHPDIQERPGEACLLSHGLHSW